MHARATSASSRRLAPDSPSAACAPRSAGSPVAEIVEALDDPEVTYAQDCYAPNRQVRQRGRLGVIVDRSTRAAITVVFRHQGAVDAAPRRGAGVTAMLDHRRNSRNCRRTRPDCSSRLPTQTPRSSRSRSRAVLAITLSRRLKGVIRLGVLAGSVGVGPDPP